MFNFSLTYYQALKIAKKLAHSMSNQETRYYLCGFYIGESGGRIVAVSTDGHRMTRITINPSYDKTQAFGAMIFPREAAKQIESFKPEGKKDEAEVVFSVDGLAYRITCGHQSVGGKLIDGTYPDFERVIPSDWDGERCKAKIGFNARYLADLGKAVAIDQVGKVAKFNGACLHIIDENSPVVITEKDKSVMHVLMPMRVD